MSQSLSWIDPSAFSAALTRAGFDATQHGSPAQMPVRSTMNFGFIGSSPIPAPSQAARPAPVSPPAASPQPTPSAPTASAAAPGSAGIPSIGQGMPSVDTAEMPDPSPQPTAPPKLEFESPRLDLRLNDYMEWVETHTGCKGLFIVDEEGLVLMEQDSDPNLVALSAYFLNLKDRIPDSLGTRSEGSIAIDLDDERVLHVVQADTLLGPHALGFTVQSPLHRDTTQAFQETLSLVFAQS